LHTYVRRKESNSNSKEEAEEVFNRRRAKKSQSQSFTLSGCTHQSQKASSWPTMDPIPQKSTLIAAAFRSTKHSSVSESLTVTDATVCGFLSSCALTPNAEPNVHSSVAQQFKEFICVYRKGAALIYRWWRHFDQRHAVFLPVVASLV
jgi:hypothetical protein